MTRRNSREALDRQLSSQALYAAETGINDAISKINEQLGTAGVGLQSQETCSDTGKYTKNGGVVDNDNQIKYTCLTVNPAPSDAQFSDVSDPKVMRLETDEPMNTIEISWKRSADTRTTATSLSACRGANKNAASWNVNTCPFGLLRADILPIVSLTGEEYRSAEIAARSTMTLFGYPQNSPTIPSVPYNGGVNIYGGTAQQGVSPNAGCTLNGVCTIKITGVNSKVAYIKVSARYVASDITVKAFQTSTSTTSMPFKGTQVVIDVTGKARDVLRRVQVRRSLSGMTTRNEASTTGFTDFALRSGGPICKRFAVAPPPADVMKHETPSVACDVD